MLSAFLRRCVPPAVIALAAVFVLNQGLAGRVTPAGQETPAGTIEARVDRVFSRWTSATPGCAVGVAVDGRVALEKAYGMADLERDVPNTAATIFEAGSVSKQFTAAAVLLLARDGKLSLDDPARKYLPELPDYGKRLTIRHMLTHTSGLRDWGTVAGIGGWPRTTRVYTHANVLEIASRQRSLNFEPGTNWSYSNTGYNLAAIIVSRVSGQPFAEFCRTRLFEPLGLTHTSWRDDFTRIVKGRALAYMEAKDGFHLEMPFENAHGNGGLLTTVGDLLKWNEHFDRPASEDASLVRSQQEPAHVASGQELDYALGLYVDRYKGLREVSHSGATAGYRAFLARYPDRRLSVAVLCNGSTGAAERYAHAVADLELGLDGGGAAKPAPVAPAVSAVLNGRAGLYRHIVTGQPLMLVQDKDMLRLNGGQTLTPTSASRFELGEGGRALVFDGKGLTVRLGNGLSERYERVAAVRPAADDLRSLSGRYASDEADVEFEVFVQDGQLMVRRRPGTVLALTPLYADAFAVPGLGTVRFVRKGGRVAGMSIVADRVWDLRLRRK